MDKSNEFEFGYGNDIDYDEDDEILNEIEAEMDADLHKDEMDVLTSVMTDTAVSSSDDGPRALHSQAHSTLPVHQVNYAAEFWFPECRDCECCRGFKYGCSCGGLCVCSAKGNDAAGLRNDAASFVPNGSKSNRDICSSKPPCKFYKMGTCRFGDSCRFSHS